MASRRDAKSRGALERVVVDGERYVVKHLHVDHYASALVSKGIDLGLVGVAARARCARRSRAVRMGVGWEKALGDDDELGWWFERARLARPYLE